MKAYRQNRSVVKKGFTLIELLVVIAIIALLLAIILPALKSVKEQAKKTICLSNSKATGTLVLTYAQQNNDQLISDIASGFNRADNGAGYYTYVHTEHPVANQGPTSLGWLWKAGLIEPGSDLPYCPSMYNLFGQRTPTKVWNPQGVPTHWNYCGKVADSKTYLAVKDYNIDWLPLRLTIGTRMLSSHGPDTRGSLFHFKRVSDACMKGKRAFLSDLWSAYYPTYWQTKDTDIPHRTGNRKSMNVWYLDGSTKNVRMEDAWFEDINNNGVKYLKGAMTWSIMFD